MKMRSLDGFINPFCFLHELGHHLFKCDGWPPSRRGRQFARISPQRLELSLEKPDVGLHVLAPVQADSSESSLREFAHTVQFARGNYEVTRLRKLQDAEHCVDV